MDLTSLIATGVFALIAAGWTLCALVSIIADLRGGLVRWWSRASA